ncbi:MAG: 2-oxo acid dehydrogenase subunit E2 [Acidimicrobiia bacterium]|nr:2-oxo acid dehydrogenase subunit E2 [Acidimicrobiia bacterium]MDH4307460.1 2-oxo acid dehydrogenase subunit E2 [Acidimicrobiia bacterium]MDH5293946.1 2-oxo acid dehydrogenase subunit E2 [Acidimicrobiia bacterium]
MTKVPMPVITAEGEEAVVTAWFVDEGDACTEGQMLAEVQAEKVSVEVHAVAAGYVADRVTIGDPVRQGDPICRITDTPRKPVVRSLAAVRASPAAKRVARELGVDLADVTGTGPEGRITEDDVRGFAGTEEGRALRSVIAKNLRKSHTDTVPVTLFTTALLGHAVPDRLTARVLKATALALAEHPALNGHRAGDEFVRSDLVNISVAIQTDEGLVAPVIHDVTLRSVEEIAARVEKLAALAETRTLAASDYAGGTFSVSNLGRWGVEGFTPVINLPQIAILGVGAARRVPVVDGDGSVTVGFELTLSLTFDHAYIDGAPAAEFLQAVVSHLTPAPRTT